jgi:hypothetical protein
MNKDAELFDMEMGGGNLISPDNSSGGAVIRILKNR